MLKISKSKILLFSLFIVSITLSQEYNPCRDKRFLSLRDIDLDDMSERQYNFFIKKEEECSKYKAKKKRKKKASRSKNKRINKKKVIKQKKKRKPIPKIKTNLLSVYFSSPVLRLQMTSGFDKTSINGIKLETPISINLGKLNPYLIFEYRNYNFSYSNKEISNLEFGGSAILGGLKLPVRLFKKKNGWFIPEFSVLTGKFHFSKGLLLCVDVPQKLSNESPLKIKYSARLNMIQTNDNSGTGWFDFGIFFGYTLSEELISKITGYFK